MAKDNRFLGLGVPGWIKKLGIGRKLSPGQDGGIGWLKSSDGYQFIERFFGVPIHRFYDLDSYLLAATEKIWITARCCDIVANSVASATFQVIDKKTKKEKINAPLNHLLGEPNPYDTWFDMIYLLVWHLKTCGVGYWVKDKGNMRGQPEALYPLLPQYVIVMPDPKTKIKQFLYRVNGKTIAFDPEEIIYFHRPHARQSIIGQGEMGSAQPLFNQLINWDYFQEAFFERGANPSGILVNSDEQQNSDEMERLRGGWESKYAGKHNTGKIAWLNGKWQFLRIGLLSQEMQQTERQRQIVSEAALAHGVPLSVVGIEKAANLATARQDEVNMRRLTCFPTALHIARTLNHSSGLIPLYDPRLELMVKMDGLIDVEQRVSDYLPLVLCGAMTLNEIRVKAGEPAKDDPYLDQHMVDQTRLPIELAGYSTPGQAAIDTVTSALNPNPPAPTPEPKPEDDDEHRDPESDAEEEEDENTP